MREFHLPTNARVTSDLVPDIRLTHGRAVGVLEAMGFSAGVGRPTFNDYIKSLRKLGVPFSRKTAVDGGRRNVLYSYNNMMELAVALNLRVYGILPDRLVSGIIQYRNELYSLYRRAYIEYLTGLGAPVRVMAKGRAEFEMSGVYLDLRIRSGGGRAIQFGPPRALSPFEALRVYSKLDNHGREHLPFNLSALAILLVEQAERTPTAWQRHFLADAD
jgi:hypothetical protein